MNNARLRQMAVIPNFHRKTQQAENKEKCSRNKKRLQRKKKRRWGEKKAILKAYGKREEKIQVQRKET